MIPRGSKKCVHMSTAAIGDLYITDPPYSHVIPRGSKKIDNNDLGSVS